MNKSILINQDSGNTEWYTPLYIIDLVRQTIGDIMLDPASSAKANEIVKAKIFYTKDDKPLERPWYGEIWMNHPFGKSEKACKPNCKKEICIDRGYHVDRDVPGNAEWINHLVTQYRIGNIRKACCITFAATSETWFRPLLLYPMCFIHKRVNYLLPDGTVKRGVTKGSVVTYLGPDNERFCRIFNTIGTVKI